MEACFGAYPLVPLPHCGTRAGAPQKRGAWLQRVTESRALAAALTCAVVLLLGLACVADEATWEDAERLFHSSFLVHMRALDLAAGCLVLVPALAWVDARRRGAGTGRPWLGLAAAPLALALPLLGPAVYLLTRPAARERGMLGALGGPAAAAVRLRAPARMLMSRLPARQHLAQWASDVGHRMRRVASFVFQVRPTSTAVERREGA
jgi:hypothetical protein